MEKIKTESRETVAPMERWNVLPCGWEDWVNSSPLLILGKMGPVLLFRPAH